MASATTPNEGMTVGIPVRRGLLHRLADLGPGLESSPLESKRPKGFPPGFDQVQVGGILRLEDELPARTPQREQQNISRPMDVQVVQDTVDVLDLGGDPIVNLLQEVQPVGNRPTRVGHSERFAVGWLEGPENVALASSTVVDLLLARSARLGSSGSGAPVPSESSGRAAFVGSGGDIDAGAACARTSALTKRCPGKLLADSGPIWSRFTTTLPGGVSVYSLVMIPFFWRTRDRPGRQTRSPGSASASPRRLGSRQCDYA